MLLTGVFALGLKKKEKYLVVKLIDGEVVCKAEIVGSMLPKINAQLANMVNQWAIKEEVSTTAVPSNADELAKYAALAKKGIITKDEFEAKKKQLLT